MWRAITPCRGRGRARRLVPCLPPRHAPPLRLFLARLLLPRRVPLVPPLLHGRLLAPCRARRTAAAAGRRRRDRRRGARRAVPAPQSPAAA